MHAIRKTFGPLSPGTQVETIRSKGGISTVRLRTISPELRQQNHPLVREIVSKAHMFEIPTDMLVKLRDPA